MQVIFSVVKRCPNCGDEVVVEVEKKSPVVVNCRRCGSQVVVGVEELVEEVRLFDCEVRDWDRIAALSGKAQQMVLQAVESERAPRELLPLLVKLRDVGALVCT